MNTLATAWAKKRGSASATGALPAPRSVGTTGQFASLGARVLVVEDNAVNQKVAVMLLAKLGVQADIACHGREALEILHDKSYHLVLMDCQMPEMNGYEATAEIRKRAGANQSVPVVAMTADVIEGSRERALHAGMNDFVAKPVELDELIRALTAWLPPRVSERRA